MKEILEFTIALILVCVAAYISYKIGCKDTHIDV